MKTTFGLFNQKKELDEHVLLNDLLVDTINWTFDKEFVGTFLWGNLLQMNDVSVDKVIGDSTWNSLINIEKKG